MWAARYLTIIGALVACSRGRSAHDVAVSTSAKPTPSATPDVVISPTTTPGSATANTPNPEKYRGPCERGDFRSCAFLGWGYYTGEGLPLDHQAAYELFRRACDHGAEQGCVPLGYMYQQGDIVPKDLDAAIAIFKPPCDRGKLEVCVALGELYE